MLNLLRCVLCLVLVVQPALCIGGGNCSAVAGVSVKAHDNCCCGDTCPAATSEATTSMSCGCIANAEPQPAQPPTRPTNEKRLADLAMSQPVCIGLVQLPVPALALKTQARQVHPIHRSTNAFLCVWLT
jgi:hypothetical protein